MEKAVTSIVGKRIAVVTGANKGIGFEICRQLASEGVVVILTARDEKRGLEAVDKLMASGLTSTLFHQLDVTDPASVASLAAFTQQQFGRLDILENNAAATGVKYQVDDPDTLKQALQDVDANAELLRKIVQQTYATAETCPRTNFYGTKQVTEALLPLLQQSNSARIVNVSSGYGQLKYVSNQKAMEKLGDADGLTVEKVDEVIKEFLVDVKHDQIEKKGWPKLFSAYKVSKAAINAYTRILAKKYPNISVNAVHPGYVKTDFNLNVGTVTVKEGARGPVMLALMPDGGPTGLFFDKTERSTF